MLDVDVGAEVRSHDAKGKPNGYRKKVKMIRFSWSAHAPKKKFRNVPHADRAKAKAAYDYLMDSKESAYKDFKMEREKFFDGKRHKPDERQRRRPLMFIEQAHQGGLGNRFQGTGRNLASHTRSSVFAMR